MQLSPVMERFIVRWGEMGSIWGINRASAQIVALLYLSESALTAEEISRTLSIARSTVSTDLRELQNWGVVRSVHVLGDRRDHFETLGDPRELLRVIIRERLRREVDPLTDILREGVTETSQPDGFVRERMQDMLEVFDVMMSLFEKSEELSTEELFTMGKQGGQLPLTTIARLARLGDGLGSMMKKAVGGEG
jgi:DNA-binding transcriptional regulator GbsR (MarR family)